MPKAQREPVDDTRSPGLTREVIVSAALELMDLQGVDGFSMRKLAARLEVSPQALYWHFKSKDDLCRAVVELVRDDVHIDVDESLSVPDRVRSHMRALRAHFSRHPCAVELGRSFLPSTAGEVTEIGVGLIRAFGITDREAALRHYRALVWAVTGFSLVEHGAETSIHHTRVSGTARYEVRILPAPGAAASDEHRPSMVVDVDELFATVVEHFVAGLTAASASS
jgi:TetR/AcrR family transcriptional regulator, tetracycline repressor protein